MAWRRHAIRGVLALFIGSNASPCRAAGGPFDGEWQVTVTCDNARDGAHGYTWEFPATIRNGALHGVYGTAGQPASFELIGTVAADGSAHFFGHGLTGQPVYSVDRVAPATRFSYHADGSFAGDRGQARRVELRPCLLDFIRR